MQRHLLIPLTILPLLAGLAAQAAPVALPPVVNTAAAAMPDLMDGLLNHKASPQDLWNSGQLNGDVLAQLLNQVPWRVPENQELANQLCGLLVEKAPDKITDPLALPSLTRRRLALYFKSIHDPRAVTFFEAILSLIKTPRATGVAEVFELSDYYNETGDWQKAVQTRLRVKDYTTAESYLANAALEAARIYMEHGETEKAQPLYERAEKSSFGWAAGAALYDEGMDFIRNKNYGDAIKTLSKPVEGLYADQIKVALLAQMSRAYYLDGDFKNARKNAEMSLEQYKTISLPLSNEGLRAQVSVAQAIQFWSNCWLNNPLEIQPSIINIDVSRLDNQTIRKIFYVQTFKDTPIEIKSTVDNVKVILAEKTTNSEYASSRKVTLELIPSVIGSKNIELVINDAKHPDTKATFTLNVKASPDIQISESNLFFGSLQIGKTTTRNILITGNTNFQITKVETTGDIKFDVNKEEKSIRHTITFSLTPHMSGFVEGDIRIFTNMKAQGVMTMSYIGQVP